jgi:hypothetical protein
MLMFDPFDRTVDRTLRQLAKQRIRAVLQPGNCWVIDCAIPQNGDTHAALLTCYMRGWVEPLERAVPSSKLPPSGSLPPNFSFETMETFYRLTSAGWSVIHRSDLIAICALLISAMSFALAIFGMAHH